MKISRKDAIVRKVDGSLTIESLFDGKGEYLIITAPPFKPENEKVVE